LYTWIFRHSLNNAHCDDCFCATRTVREPLVAFESFDESLEQRRDLLRRNFYGKNNVKLLSPVNDDWSTWRTRLRRARGKPFCD